MRGALDGSTASTVASQDGRLSEKAASVKMSEHYLIIPTTGIVAASSTTSSAAAAAASAAHPFGDAHAPFLDDKHRRRECTLLHHELPTRRARATDESDHASAGSAGSMQAAGSKQQAASSMQAAGSMQAASSRQAAWNGDYKSSDRRARALLRRKHASAAGRAVVSSLPLRGHLALLVALLHQRIGKLPFLDWRERLIKLHVAHHALDQIAPLHDGWLGFVALRPDKLLCSCRVARLQGGKGNLQIKLQGCRVAWLRRNFCETWLLVGMLFRGLQGAQNKGCKLQAAAYLEHHGEEEIDDEEATHAHCSDKKDQTRGVSSISSSNSSNISSSRGSEVPSLIAGDIPSVTKKRAIHGETASISKYIISDPVESWEEGRRWVRCGQGR